MYYIVKSGDTLHNIAIQYGTTISNLLNLNPQINNPNLIYTSESILINSSNQWSNKPKDVITGTIANASFSSLVTINISNPVTYASAAQYQVFINGAAASAMVPLNTSTTIYPAQPIVQIKFFNVTGTQVGTTQNVTLSDKTIPNGTVIFGNGEVFDLNYANSLTNQTAIQKAALDSQWKIWVKTLSGTIIDNKTTLPVPVNVLPAVMNYTDMNGVTHVIQSGV